MVNKNRLAKALALRRRACPGRKIYRLTPNSCRLYGEGDKAFLRLQEEIIRSVPDLSLFAWSGAACRSGCLLAQSPSDFAGANDVVMTETASPFQMTNQGLLIDAVAVEGGFWAYRGFAHNKRVCISLLCRKASNDSDVFALKLCHVDSIQQGRGIPTVADIPLHLRGRERMDYLDQETPDTIGIYQVVPDLEGLCPHDGGQSSRLLETSRRRVQSRRILIQRKLEYPQPTFRIFLHTDEGPGYSLDPSCDDSIVSMGNDPRHGSGYSVGHVYDYDNSRVELRLPRSSSSPLSDLPLGINVCFGYQPTTEGRKLRAHACEDPLRCSHQDWFQGLAPGTGPRIDLDLGHGWLMKVDMSEVKMARMEFIDVEIDWEREPSSAEDGGEGDQSEEDNGDVWAQDQPKQDAAEPYEASTILGMDFEFETHE